MGLFDASSTARQETVNVSGSGQYNKKSTVIQSGSAQYKIGKHGKLIINEGPAPDLLQSLSQPSQPIVVQSPAPAPAPAGTAAKSDSSATDTKKLLAIAAAAVVGLFLFKRIL